MWSTDPRSNQHAQQNRENGKAKTLGMTSAISTAEPKPEDISQTKKLEKTLGK